MLAARPHNSRMPTRRRLERLPRDLAGPLTGFGSLAGRWIDEPAAEGDDLFHQELLGFDPMPGQGYAQWAVIAPAMPIPRYIGQ